MRFCVYVSVRVCASTVFPQTSNRRNLSLSVCLSVSLWHGLFLFAMPGRSKGGVRQRLGLKHARPALQRSEHAAGLTEEIAHRKFQRGKCSAPDAQELINAAKADANKSSSSAASLRPSNTKNTSRDLVRKLDKTTTMPEVYEFDGTFWDEASNCQVVDTSYMLLPYEVFDAVAETPADWQGLGADTPLYEARRLWGQRISPPIDDVGDIMATSLWGDAAPVSSTDSLYLLLWSCLAPSAPNKRYWIHAMPKSIVCRCGCYGRHTFDSILQVIVWSYLQWLLGIHPAHRHDGEPFRSSRRRGDRRRAKRAGENMKTRAALLKKKGDWAWLKQLFNLAGWHGGADTNVCWICRATLGGAYPFTDPSVAAAWRGTLVSGLEFMMSLIVNGKYICPL